MVNKYRGEISATLNGQSYTLCLTLGALAQLEEHFSAADMLCVAERFASGRISAADCIVIIGEGLRSSGHDFTNEEVAQLKSAEGAAGYVQIVASLLEATFGTSQTEDSTGQEVVADKEASSNMPGKQGKRPPSQ